MTYDLKKPQNEFWNLAAKTKEFKDPFYLSAFQDFVDKNSLVIEYGCGYGRLLNRLHQNKFHNLQGFDFSEGMIERGERQFPHLRLSRIAHAELPLADASVDAALLSTVLCCVPDNQAQEQIIQELARVLKPKGIFYVTDFLVSDSSRMMEKYQKAFPVYKEWGVYQTSEGALVRHYTPERLSQLFTAFDPHWYQEEDFVTMNNNPVKTFHGIYKKKQQLMPGLHN